MGLASRGVGAITLFVEDLRRSKAFYRDVFEADVAYEDDESVVFRFGNTLVNLLAATAAGELVEPGTVGAADGGLRCQLTIWVDDADAVCAQLAKHDVTLLNGPVDRPWGQRTASFTDPSGHLWEIAQSLSLGG